MDILQKLKAKSRAAIQNLRPTDYQDAAIIQPEANAFGTILGQIDNSGKYPIVFRMDGRNRLNRSILATGGQDKLESFAKNFIFQAVKRRESILINDPESRLFNTMSSYLSSKGYAVRYLDLDRPELSDSWEPFQPFFYAENCPGAGDPGYAAFLAHAIVDPAWGDSSESSAAAQDLLMALILRVVYGIEYDEKTLTAVFQLLKTPYGLQYLDTLFTEEFQGNAARMAIESYEKFKKHPEPLQQDVFKKLPSLVEPLLKIYPAASEFPRHTVPMDMHLPGNAPCAYFIKYSRDSQNARVATFFFGAFYRSLFNDSDALAKRGAVSIPTPVNFLLHEMSSIGQIFKLDFALATSRKRNVNFCMTANSIQDLSQTYESWLTVSANCSTHLAFSPYNAADIDMIQKWVGPGEVVFDRKSLQDDTVVILLHFHEPIFAKEYPYTLHSEAADPIIRADAPADIISLLSHNGLKEYREGRDAVYKEYMRIFPKANEVNRAWFGECESIPVPDSILERVIEPDNSASSKKLVKISDYGATNLEAVAILENISQSALVDRLLTSPCMFVKAQFLGRDANTVEPIANIVEYYQAQSSRAMSLEKSRELLYLIEDVAKAILVDSEKLRRQNKYLYSNMVDVLKMPEFAEICQDMEAHRFCTTAQFQQLVETMLENISDRQVYASPFLFRNLVVILRDFSQWFGGQTSLDWYTKAKPVIEFLLA